MHGHPLLAILCITPGPRTITHQPHTDLRNYPECKLGSMELIRRLLICCRFLLHPSIQIL